MREGGCSGSVVVVVVVVVVTGGWKLNFFIAMIDMYGLSHSWTGHGSPHPRGYVRVYRYTLDNYDMHLHWNDKINVDL